ncbi:GNAT family N-acetyltransferase [Halorarum halobium]|uniref:GNAT family N-acetyltransferase n=1 Tax=Halorarum halobium TaxID=3075121 RepID=UPI0028B23E2B|nr:GNAT family N-acetyltransferase [Halobaculum sp. XH14]
MDDLEVRPARTADADRLAAVYRSAYERNRELGFPAKAESATGAEVAEWISERRVYVATVGDDPVGGVRLEETDPGRVKLGRLAVHDRWKGRGIGGRLLDHAEEAGRDLGAETVRLTTPEGHPFLPALYRDRGYEKTGEYPLAYREYDEIVLEKQLR